MDFGKNLSTLRRKIGISQEDLAEKLNVTRQTIYKWESGVTYPDIDKLMDIAKILDVSYTSLIDGEKETVIIPKKTILNKYSLFSNAIGVGVALILLGVALMILFSNFSFYGASVIGITLMLAFIFSAVIAFVVSSIKQEAFKTQALSLTFTADEISKERSSFIIKIAIGLALIFLGVIAVVIVALWQDESYSLYSIVLLLILVGIACYLFITAGIMHELYTKPEQALTPEDGKKKNLSESISGIIMTLSTAVYLILGFVFDLWHPGWVIFPIGGILCGVVSTIETAIKGKSTEDNDTESKD